MLRYSVRLAVLLFAIAIGIFATRGYEYVLRPSLFSPAPKQELRQSFVISEAVITRKAEPTRLECADPLADKLLKKMLEIREIRTELQKEAQIGTFDCSQLNHRRLDLNGDGRDEHIVRLWVDMMCGTKGNCPAAIFSETRNGLRRLYYHSNKIYLEVLRSRSNGYLDIDAEFHSGVAGLYIERTKFDGKRYSRTSCRNEYDDGTFERVKCWDVE